MKWAILGTRVFINQNMVSNMGTAAQLQTVSITHTLLQKQDSMSFSNEWSVVQFSLPHTLSSTLPSGPHSPFNPYCSKAQKVYSRTLNQKRSQRSSFQFLRYYMSFALCHQWNSISASQPQLFMFSGYLLGNRKLELSNGVSMVKQVLAAKL